MLDRDLESIQEARRLVEQAAKAQEVLEHFSQEQTDAVVAAMAEAARQHAEPLARLAVEETTYGVVADKVDKNLFSARDVYNAIRHLKTVGIIREDPENGVTEVAVPAGVVAAIIPCTNPTSTAIFKALIALKGRNAIVMSPHPAAVHCIQETARVMLEAALQAGAPEGCLGCLSQPTMEATQELMRHRSTAIILATGGAGLVRAAYSSGKPALGVGPGNVPAYVHSSANVPKAVADILTGKTFDNGTICSSEQHMVVDAAIADRFKAEVERQGGFFLDSQQAAAVARALILPNFRVNSKMVGQSAERIAREAGITIPPSSRALVAPLEGVGRKYPLSAEKLSPVLSFYVVKDWQQGLEVCTRLLEFGGMGHTMAIHAGDDKVTREFALKAPAFRLVVNTPAPHGSIGYSTKLFPSMSLGCGTPGGNITSDNISPMHLVNIKRLAYERRPVNRVEDSGEIRRVAADGSSPAPQPRTTPLLRVASTPTGSRLKEPNAAEISGIVERFLARRSKAAGSPAPAASNATQAGPALPKVIPSSAAATKQPTPETPAAPRPVEFVSEEDVRVAIQKGAKIHVSPRTIITPSARDLGDPCEIFVMTKGPEKDSPPRSE
ncbi:MAG TPA: aldehyde dehydrogenase family protein [Terriglobia bacterium]|nr:aldehyde dehydrogenase family protein [Terriglobia bacterium]